MKRIARFAFVLSLCLVCNVVAAQNIRYAGANPTNFFNVDVGNDSTITRTVNVAFATDLSQITAVSVTGSGFSKVGGSCTGFIVSPASPCTLLLRFSPAAVGPASGNLFINCATSIPAGGVTIVCDGAGGNIGLIGNALAALVVPTMSPAALTVLALLIMAAMVITLRRRRRG